MVEEALEEALAHLPFPVVVDVFPSEPAAEDIFPDEPEAE